VSNKLIKQPSLHPSVVANIKRDGINIYIPMGEFANLLLPLSLKSARSLSEVLSSEIAKCEKATADPTSAATAARSTTGFENVGKGADVK
jgi:hypothetical protein